MNNVLLYFWSMRFAHLIVSTLGVLVICEFILPGLITDEYTAAWLDDRRDIAHLNRSLGL